MHPASASFVLSVTRWTLILSYPFRTTLGQTASLLDDTAASSPQAERPRPLDLLCVCGKGGTCLDRSVDFDKIPKRRSRECFCNISKGYYDDCDQLVNHCDEMVCLNGGSCVMTFGGFFCVCRSEYMGMMCETDRPEGVVPAEAPMTFSFIHTTTNESKQLYLAVQSLGSNFEATVNFGDGRVLHLKEANFSKIMSLMDLCTREYNAHPMVHDDNVCDLLFAPAESKFFVATVVPNYPLRLYQASDPGRVDPIVVTFKNSDIVVLRQNLSFFTPFYGVHNYSNENPCQYKIVFRGCGKFYNTLRNYYVPDPFVVMAIRKPVRVCRPVKKQRIGYWRYYPNDSDTFIEERDEGTTGSKIFQPFTFKRGRRFIEYFFKEIGDERYYGLNNEYVSRGRCSVTIWQGHGDLFIVGGSRRTYPCYEDLNLELSTTNPSIAIGDYRVLWQCNSTPAVEFCNSRESIGNHIAYEDVPCDREYHFSARLLSDDFKSDTAYQTVVVQNSGPEFYITCLHNCEKYFEPSEYIRLSFYISITVDSSPVWRITANGHSVSVKNRTEAASIFIPGPLDYLFLEPSDNDTLRVTATIGEMVSELILKRADLNYAGHCEVYPQFIRPLQEFNINCESDDKTEIKVMVLAEKSSLWSPLMTGDIVAETDDMNFYEVAINTDNVNIVIYDSRSWQSLVLREEFEPPIILAEYVDLEAVMRKLFIDIDRHSISGNYIDAVSSMNQLFLLLAVGESDDEYSANQWPMTEKLAKFPAPKSLLGIYKHLSVINELGKLDFSTKKGRSHLIMRHLAATLTDVVSNYANLIKSTTNLKWLEKTQPTFIQAVFDLVSNLLVLAYPEFEIGKIEVDDDFPYFLFEAKYGGNTMLNLIDLMRITLFPSPLYGEREVYSAFLYSAWFKTDSLAMINKDLVNLENYILFRGGDEALKELFHYNTLMLLPQSFWWVGDHNAPHSIIGPVITAALVDYDTEKRVRFSNNTVHFTIIDELSPDELWDNEDYYLVGESKNALEGDTEEKKDRSLLVWQLQVPSPSTGKLFINALHAKPFKLYTNLGRFPSYSDVFNSPVERKKRVPIEIDFKVSSSVASNKFYVAVLPENGLPGKVISYTLAHTALICLNYIKNDWKRSECAMLEVSTLSSKVVCQCPRVSWHAVEKVNLIARTVLPDSFYISPPESGKFNVFGNLIATFVLFVSLYVWAYWKDKKSVRTNVVHLLEVPAIQYKFQYLISVHTGSHIGSGTDSSIGFQLVGRNARCCPHLFRYRMTRGRLSTGREDWFIVQSLIHLGDLTRVEVWNDFSGVLSDWYCEKIIVYDLTRMEAHEILVRRWLTRVNFPGSAKFTVLQQDFVTENDSELNSRRPTGGTERVDEFIEFRRYVVNQINESHHWGSLISKQNRNIYAYKERAVLLMSFISSVMFNAMLVQKIAGRSLEAPNVVFRHYEAAETALALLAAYVVHAVVIILFEKSCDPVRRFKPGNSKHFRTEAHFFTENGHHHRPRALQSQTRSEKGKKRFKWVHKHITSNLIAPSSYYPWLDVVNTRKASRPKLFTWYLAWMILCTCNVIGSLVYLFMCGLETRTVNFEQWTVNYGVALLVDAVIVDPLRITVKSIILFFCNHRRVWDNFYIQGICETQVEEENKINYYKELQVRLFRRKKSYERKRKIKITSMMIVSSRWFTTATSLALLLIFLKLGIEDERKAQWVKVSSLKEATLEPSQREHLGLKDVRNASEFVAYLTSTFLPSLHRYRWYNGKPLLREPKTPFNVSVDARDDWSFEEYIRGWVGDNSGKIVGVPIIRQLRVRPIAPRDTIFSRFYNSSEALLWFLTTETGDFSKNWSKYEDIGQKRVTWMYSTDYGVESVLWNFFRHPINGYIHELYTTLGPSKRNITTIYLYNWFDQRTRYVSVNFASYSTMAYMYTYGELKVTVSPQCFYRGKLWIQNVPAPLTDSQKTCLILALCLAILFTARTWAKMRVRGFENNFHLSNFTVDVILVAACVLLVIFCSLRILRSVMAPLYLSRTFRSDFIRLFELQRIEFLIYAAVAGVIVALVFILASQILMFTQQGIINDRHYNSVSSVALSSFLLFFYFHEIVRGVLYTLFKPPHTVLATRAILRDYGDYLDGLSSVNDHHLRWLVVMFLTLRSFNLSSFLRVYRKRKEKAIMIHNRGLQRNPLTSVSKVLRDFRVTQQAEKARSSTWRWFSASLSPAQ